MVVPKRVARFNRIATNRVLRPLAGRAPGFAVFRHRGRRSGRFYQTPVNAFARGDGYVIALIYGADSDWVRNVLAAGGCALLVRRRQLQMTSPRIVQDQTRRDVPRAVRVALRTLRVDHFLHLQVGDASR